MPEEEQEKALQEKLKNMSPAELLEFQKQQCIFCQIIAEKIPAKKVYEDEVTIGVLDINPAAKGHILLLPKEHYAIMPQVPDAVLAHLFLVSKYISQVLLKVLKVTGTSVFVANGAAAGQRAPHFMLHIIPRKEGDNLLVITEKLLDKNIQQKVKIAIEGKLDKILGIKKETKPIEQIAEENEKEEKVVEQKKESSPQKAKSPKKKKIQKEEEIETGEVILDDIASLFK